MRHSGAGEGGLALTAGHQRRKEPDRFALHALCCNEELYLAPCLAVDLERQQQGVEELP